MRALDYVLTASTRVENECEGSFSLFAVEAKPGDRIRQDGALITQKICPACNTAMTVGATWKKAQNRWLARFPSHRYHNPG